MDDSKHMVAKPVKNVNKLDFHMCRSVSVHSGPPDGKFIMGR